MTHTAFDEEVDSIEERFKERHRLAQLTIEELGESAIVHSVKDPAIFTAILTDGCLKLPHKNTLDKKTTLMEKMLGLDNCIYLSAGYVYATSFNWKYNLLFSVDIIKEMTYYAHSINYQAYVKIINYWTTKDKPYIKKLLEHNNQCRTIIKEHVEQNKPLAFWKIEETLDTFIKDYPYQEQIQKIFSELKSTLLKKTTEAKKDAKTIHQEERSPEIISFKKIQLEKNPYFIGFYIKGDIAEDITNILKKKYPGKILFDGNTFKKI